jgi:hypothetical protein
LPFYNSAGELVDVKYASTMLIVLGHDEIAFWVETKKSLPRSDYACHKTPVKHAFNGRAWRGYW